VQQKQKQTTRMSVELYDITAGRFIQLDQELSLLQVLMQLGAKNISILFDYGGFDEWLPIDSEHEWSYMKTYCTLRQNKGYTALSVKIEQTKSGLSVEIPKLNFQQARLLADEYEEEYVDDVPEQCTVPETPISFNDMFSIMLSTQPGGNK
jgi:hypothetical protein